MTNPISVYRQYRLLPIEKILHRSAPAGEYWVVLGSLVKGLYQKMII